MMVLMVDVPRGSAEGGKDINEGHVEGCEMVDGADPVSASELALVNRQRCECQ